MKNKREIIDNSHYHQCYKCLGTGLEKNLIDKTKHSFTLQYKVCSTCKGTGKWKEEHYYLVTEHRGKKICFDVDNLGK